MDLRKKIGEALPKFPIVHTEYKRGTYSSRIVVEVTAGIQHVQVVHVFDNDFGESQGCLDFNFDYTLRLLKQELRNYYGL